MRGRARYFMKVVILSDIHDNVENLKKVMPQVRGSEFPTLIFCGDLCAPSTLEELVKFDGEVHFIFGNVDGDQYAITHRAFTKFSNLVVYGEVAEFSLGKFYGQESKESVRSESAIKKVAVVHREIFARALAATGKYDLVCYGHTHKAKEKRIGKTLLLNPGEVAGLQGKATYAIYDTETDKVKFREIK